MSTPRHASINIMNKDNCNETFSNAASELVVNILTHEKFLASLRK